MVTVLRDKARSSIYIYTVQFYNADKIFATFIYDISTYALQYNINYSGAIDHNNAYCSSADDVAVL